MLQRYVRRVILSRFAPNYNNWHISTKSIYRQKVGKGKKATKQRSNEHVPPSCSFFFSPSFFLFLPQYVVRARAKYNQSLVTLRLLPFYLFTFLPWRWLFDTRLLCSRRLHINSVFPAHMSIVCILCGKKSTRYLCVIRRREKKM